jgi:hypothetical protein
MPRDETDAGPSVAETDAILARLLDTPQGQRLVRNLDEDGLGRDLRLLLRTAYRREGPADPAAPVGADWIGPPSLPAVLGEVGDEVIWATANCRPMSSGHEGWAVLHEGMDVLWGHVCTPESQRDHSSMRRTTLWLAAEAVRFVRQVCDQGRDLR